MTPKGNSPFRSLRPLGPHNSSITESSKNINVPESFALWDTGPAEARAASSIMTVKEGTYELKLARSRLVDHFYSVEKIANEISQETIEILRGNRLTVEIEGLYDASNKLGYAIKSSYQDLTKKKKNEKKEKTEKTEKSSDKEPKENRSQLFMPITE